MTPSKEEVQQLYDEAMTAAKQVLELTRLMKKKAAKKIVEPMVRSSNSVCNNFLLAWQARDTAPVFSEKMNSAIRDARSTRDLLSAAADANKMPVEKTRAVVKNYDDLIARLENLQKQGA